MPSYGDPLFFGQLVGTVVAFTFLFDMLDLRPLVGSFAFAGTRTYHVYLLFRLIVAGAACALIVSTQPNVQPILVGMVAVIGGVVLLQGLALNVAGQDVVDLASLVGRYKETMVEEAAAQRARALNAEILSLTNDVLGTLTSFDELLHEWESVLLLLYAGDMAAVGTRVAEIRAQVQQDPELARRTLASLVVQANPEYARRMLPVWRERKP